MEVICAGNLHHNYCEYNDDFFLLILVCFVMQCNQIQINSIACTLFSIYFQVWTSLRKVPQPTRQDNPIKNLFLPSCSCLRTSKNFWLWPFSSVVKILVSVREVWGSNPGSVKSDAVSPTARHGGFVLPRR